MSEKPPQPEVIFVSPEEGADWEAYAWSSQEVAADIYRAYEVYRFALTDIGKVSETPQDRYADLLQQAASELAEARGFSRSDLLRLTALIQDASIRSAFDAKHKTVQGPLSAKDVCTLYERALRLAEMEAGTSER